MPFFYCTSSHIFVQCDLCLVAFLLVRNVLLESISLCAEKSLGLDLLSQQNKKASIIARDTQASCAQHPRAVWIFRNDNWMGWHFFPLPNTSRQLTFWVTMIYDICLGSHYPWKGRIICKGGALLRGFSARHFFPFQQQSARSTLSRRVSAARCRDAASLDACVRACVWKRVRYAKWGPPRNKTGLLLCAPPTKRKDGFKVSRLIDIKLEWAASDEKNARTHTQAYTQRRNVNVGVHRKNSFLHTRL
jgi:hypothetical protein